MMADIFISYSKRHSRLTEDFARDLEAEGYSTWWDTNLLPDDGFFPETIRTEIESARAVIVIWAEHSVTSRWVYSEAMEGERLGKLLQVRDEALNLHRVPMPFSAGNISPISERSKILMALSRKGVIPSNTRTLFVRPVGIHPYDGKEITAGIAVDGLGFVQYRGFSIRISANEVATIGLNKAASLLHETYPNLYKE